MDQVKSLLPQVGRVEQLGGDSDTTCWRAFDRNDNLIAYAFTAIVPEAATDEIDMEDMDRYQIVGMLDPSDYKVIALDIALDPSGPDKPWEIKITEREFEQQYLGLTAEEIWLSPDGKIDAITDATLSSTWVTQAIRQKVLEIIDRATAVQRGSGAPERV